ncbi:MAG: MerR family DNA-binding transcriptional regulator [Burkholderiales bacterium]|nr:MerR family DNA-binding transcriptional regulator [Burkholderiales bacterium]
MTAAILGTLSVYVNVTLALSHACAPQPAPAAARAANPPEPRVTQTYRIADLAREFDITPRAIRFYEDQGLLAPSREGSGLSRVYTTRDRTRLKLTLRGKRLGLALSEIRELIDMYESPKDEAAQLAKFLEVLAAHRAQLEQQRVDLEAQLKEIGAFENQCRKRLAEGRGRRR